MRPAFHGPLAAAVLAAGASAGVAAAAPGVVDPRIRIDLAGYRPADPKVAILAEPRVGFDAPDPLAPSPTIEVRRFADDTLAWSGPAVAWRGGATHAQSGDGVWWVDFSALTETGSFYVFDPGLGAGSHRFEIADDVYRTALDQAVRAFYYQRCGTDKDPAHAGTAWADSACHLGPAQDADCRSVLDTSPATSRDLSGGWHDAGDYNKYVNFADGPVHDLLAAWEVSPAAWGDDLGLPESGNCVPDLLDEAKWELDWMLRMQLADGSVLHKVSVTTWAAASPPSTDVDPRRYAPATASATISACGAFAHGAAVFRALGEPSLAAYADTLEAAARSAWAWLEANPGAIPYSYDNSGFVNAAAEDGDYEQSANRVCAGAYLFALTGEAAFRGYVDANHGGVHLLQWTYAYPFESEYQDCLLYYSAMPGATAAVAADIRDAYRTSISGASHLDHVRAGDDAYRAYLADADYTWGSSRTKAHQGLMYLAMVHHGLDPANDAEYLAAALGYAHYLHGVNPLAMAHLTNMSAYGIERSASEVYHSWFGDGTPWDSATTSLYGPAPGIVPGGANPSYRPDPAYTGPPIEPPENQPIQKSYRDWNTSWPENSWEVTENSITYQAAYVRLVGALAAAAAATGPPASPGNSLRAWRSGTGVALDWDASAAATWYEVLRCDATGADCAPAPHATSPTTDFAETPPAGRDFRYEVAAANGCGSTR